MSDKPGPFNCDPDKCHVCTTCGAVILANEPHIRISIGRLHFGCVTKAMEELK